MDINYPNRIFEVRESVVKFCQNCKVEFENPSAVYYVRGEVKKICCTECASKHEDKELKLFVDMDTDPKVKVIKEFLTNK